MVDQYYDLVAFPTIQPHVFKQLEILKDNKGAEFADEACLQLGLCYSVGFGTNPDVDKATALVFEAAERGLRRAQEMMAKFHDAFSFSVYPGRKMSIIQWLIQSARNGSVSALADLSRWDHDEYRVLLSDLRRRANCPGLSTSLQGQLALGCGDTALTQRLIDNGWDVNEEGTAAGETPLHLSTLLPEQEALPLLSLLLENGANPRKKTWAAYPHSSAEHIHNSRLSHSTALEWAIQMDKKALVEKFMGHDSLNNSKLRKIQGVSEESWFKIFQAYICLAARYHSHETLQFFGAALKGDHNDPDGVRTMAKLVNAYDQRGFSAFYYAIRPDFFDRLFRTSTLKKPDSSSLNATREELVVEKLVEYGSDMNVHKMNFFNCLHLTAVIGSLPTLRSLLDYQKCSELLDSPSVFGWTALPDAIQQGKFEAFKLLLEYKASLRKAWPDPKNHALHVCALLAGDRALDFAAHILSLEPDCVDTRAKDGRTPLHAAAWYGHRDLARYLLDKGANPMATTRMGFTPLGMAVCARALSTVMLLSGEYQSRNMPLVAAYSNRALVPYSLSAVNFLLKPGLQSDFDFHVAQPTINQYGCYDHPFSDSSRIVLQNLLDHYEDKPRVRNFLVLTRLLESTWQYDGGFTGIVQTANIEALKLILRYFDPDLRHLLRIAYQQRQIGEQHLASEKARAAMIIYLKGLLDSRHDRMKAARQGARINEQDYPRSQRDDISDSESLASSSVLRRMWTLYYRFYGDMEFNQFQRELSWRDENRRNYDTSSMEFYQWWHPKLSWYPVAYTVLWTFLVPFLVCLELVAVAPTSHIDGHDRGLLALFIIIVSSHVPSKIGIECTAKPYI